MVFDTLVSAFGANTSRYSQIAREYKPDWQRSYESARVSSNRSANRASLQGAGASALLANSHAATVTNRFTGQKTQVVGLNTSSSILGNLGSKLIQAGKTGEQLAIQAATRRLGDPVERLLKERNPLYKKQELPPIPQLRKRARDFLSKLRDFQGVGGKNLKNPFPKASARVNEDQVFFDDAFTKATVNYELSRNYYLRVAIDRNKQFNVSDTLEAGIAGSETPTHVAVNLHGGKVEGDKTAKRVPYGRLEIYDSATDTVLRTLNGNETELLTYAEFQKLRYVNDNEYSKEKIDYFNFITLKDNGDGVLDENDERGSFEETTFAINNISRNDTVSGQWGFRGSYATEKLARFNTVVIDLEGTFVGADALTDYLNGDLTLNVAEFGRKENVAKLDEAASSGNKLVFKFDYAYDGVHFTAKYSDNEVENSAIKNATVVFD
ncbi:MAG: hypothetical protein K0U45_08240 [Alphaproteobacteria bacterium]|nr:hypothetical protein [Alphaproteobacteria bacterium]